MKGSNAGRRCLVQQCCLRPCQPQRGVATIAQGAALGKETSPCFSPVRATRRARYPRPFRATIYSTTRTQAVGLGYTPAFQASWIPVPGIHMAERKTSYRLTARENTLPARLLSEPAIRYTVKVRFFAFILTYQYPMPKYVVRHGVMRNLGVFSSRASELFARDAGDRSHAAWARSRRSFVRSQ